MIYPRVFDDLPTMFDDLPTVFDDEPVCSLSKQRNYVHVARFLLATGEGRWMCNRTRPEIPPVVATGGSSAGTL